MSESALWALNPSRARQTVPFVRSGVQGPRAEARGRQKNVNVVDANTPMPLPPPRAILRVQSQQLLTRTRATPQLQANQRFLLWYSSHAGHTLPILGPQIKAADRDQ
ncbi:hypothetical protein J7T55_010170 [Diaporthe amygdali]|uniref:uncharacterized protein n=1 Tax=Phomopsis amygdali TaxID=1214568 RepID=UPI0022FE3626|nr:uncharacterized protein J7T55_010170 [Diaporthe amygdali]KAJ0113926.1 hypothetical protein J7T55_010170 [Diaporthe amygdali]